MPAGRRRSQRRDPPPDLPPEGGRSENGGRARPARPCPPARPGHSRGEFRPLASPVSNDRPAGLNGGPAPSPPPISPPPTLPPSQHRSADQPRRSFRKVALSQSRLRGCLVTRLPWRIAACAARVISAGQQSASASKTGRAPISQTSAPADMPSGKSFGSSTTSPAMNYIPRNERSRQIHAPALGAAYRFNRPGLDNPRYGPARLNHRFLRSLSNAALQHKKVNHDTRSEQNKQHAYYHVVHAPGPAFLGPPGRT